MHAEESAKESIIKEDIFVSIQRLSLFWMQFRSNKSGFLWNNWIINPLGIGAGLLS